MNLRNAIKMTALAGLATLALPMTAQADIPFGAWTVAPGTGTVGVITTNCTTSGNTGCTVLVSGEGFLQEEVTFGGATYIHTVITDPNANGNPNVAGEVPYSDESYVLRNGTRSGIAAKQSTDDAAFQFSGSTTMYTGWAATDAGIKPAGEANMNIAQSFADNGGDASGDEFGSSFGLKIDLDSNGDQTGKLMSIGQTVEMGNGVLVNTTDIQKFVIEQRTGTLLAAANTGLKLGNTQFDVDGVPLNGTNNTGTDTTLPAPVNWLAGDDVMFVWLGQKVSDQVGSSPSVFGYESATVVAADRTGTPNDQFATTFATNTTDPVANNNANISTALPFNWDDAVMGAAPTVGIP